MGFCASVVKMAGILCALAQKDISCKTQLLLSLFCRDAFDLTVDLNLFQSQLASRAYIRTWHDLRNDMIDVLDHVAVPAAVQHGIPKERTFLGGHSMGGLTAVLVAQHRPGTYAGNDSWGSVESTFNQLRTA